MGKPRGTRCPPRRTFFPGSVASSWGPAPLASHPSSASSGPCGHRAGCALFRSRTIPRAPDTLQQQGAHSEGQCADAELEILRMRCTVSPEGEGRDLICLEILKGLKSKSRLQLNRLWPRRNSYLTTGLMHKIHVRVGLPSPGCRHQLPSDTRDSGFPPSPASSGRSSEGHVV